MSVSEQNNRRCGEDRRSGIDRRQGTGGLDRRTGNERRQALLLNHDPLSGNFKNEASLSSPYELHKNGFAGRSAPEVKQDSEITHSASHCPKCKDMNLKRIRREYWMRFLPGSKYYECQTCYHKFIHGYRSFLISAILLILLIIILMLKL